MYDYFFDDLTSLEYIFKDFQVFFVIFWGKSYRPSNFKAMFLFIVCHGYWNPSHARLQYAYDGMYNLKCDHGRYIEQVSDLLNS